MSDASNIETISLDTLILNKKIELGRGEIISKIDIENYPGSYPIYSSSAHNNGKFGEYGRFIFNEELVSWSVDGGGDFFYRPKHKFSVTNVSGFMRIKDEALDCKFIFYSLALQHSYLTFDYTTKAHPSVIRKLYSLPVFSKEIQQKIATILTSIDTAIEKTEALIHKYQQIKAGLMHDLFTRGVTADGKLRPPREQAPELYQETPIGWVPREWGVEEIQYLLAPIGNNLRSGPFGSALLKSELVEDGIPFLGIDNIHVEKFVDNFKRFVSEKKFLELNKYSVRPYDVVITIMGTVGRCSVIPKTIDKALSSKHLWTMTFDTNKVIPDLICWQLNYSAWVKAWFRRETQGGIMDAIQSNTLKKLILPVPDLPEQSRIHSRYISLNQKLSCEQQSLRKLELQKQGLMQDLLTGKVRVKLDQPETADV